VFGRAAGGLLEGLRLQISIIDVKVDLAGPIESCLGVESMMTRALNFAEKANFARINESAAAGRALNKALGPAAVEELRLFCKRASVAPAGGGAHVVVVVVVVVVWPAGERPYVTAVFPEKRKEREKNFASVDSN